MKKIKVLVADDHTLFRKGLVNILNSSPELEVVAEAAHGFDVLKTLAEKNEVDVILMDLNMPQLDGIETLKRIQSRGFKVPVIMVSMEYNELRVIQLIRLGAKGYILKESDPEELVEAIQRVYESGFFFNKVISPDLLEKVNGKIWDKPMAQTQLTDREIEFLSWMCSDLTIKEIADKMGLQPKTLEGYRDDLFDKLNLKSRIGLALYAFKSGLVKPDFDPSLPPRN